MIAFVEPSSARSRNLDALHDHPQVRPGLRLGAGVLVQPAPALAGREIHDDDPVGTLIGGVGDERGTRLAPAQVEPDVVEVGRGQRDVGREQDRLHDLVAGQVDTHQLRPAGGDAAWRHDRDLRCGPGQVPPSPRYGHSDMSPCVTARNLIAQ